MVLLTYSRPHLLSTSLRCGCNPNLTNPNGLYTKLFTPSTFISKQSSSKLHTLSFKSHLSEAVKQYARKEVQVHSSRGFKTCSRNTVFQVNHRVQQGILTTATRSNVQTKVPFYPHVGRTLFQNQSIKYSSSSSGGKGGQSFIQWWLAPKEIPPRWTLRWYGEMVLICTVFAITGTSTMVLVRPAVSEVLGLKGSLKDGPWDYRICSIVIMTPLYACNLVLVGTIFGRHAYFRHFAVKMFSRFGIPPELMDPTFKQTAKNFRKY